ncbi:MAG: POTRA domain-containing protein [Niabella sp.]
MLPVFAQNAAINTIASEYAPAMLVGDSLQSLDSTAKYFIINKIILEGNKRTNDKIILRELAFTQGDSIRIEDLPESFRDAEYRLQNLSLFHEAHLSVSNLTPDSIDIKIAVKERWYIWPFPYLKPVDRNLSQWAFKEKMSLSRVDYGLKLMLDNFTGNNDKLRFFFITGYTKQLMLSYRRPFIDKNMKWGINFDMAIGKNHEINYNTIGDKQVFLKLHDKNFAKIFFNTRVEATYRPAFYTQHSFGVSYNKLRVNDSVLILNPNYFKQLKNTVSYPEVYYRLNHRNFDYNPYPTKGHAFELLLAKRGFGRDVDMTIFGVKGIKYWPLTNRAYFNMGTAAAIKVPFRQPYYTSQLLGYDDFYLRGYEYYVVDGAAGGVFHTTLAQQIANFKLHIPGTKWLTPKLIPLKIYGKVFGNVGYAYHPNPASLVLNNKLLFGGGIGLDVVTMYDFTLKIEWSFNQLGQNSLYLQKKSTFQ